MNRSKFILVISGKKTYSSVLLIAVNFLLNFRLIWIIWKWHSTLRIDHHNLCWVVSKTLETGIAVDRDKPCYVCYVVLVIHMGLYERQYNATVLSEPMWKFTLYWLAFTSFQAFQSCLWFRLLYCSVRVWKDQVFWAWHWWTWISNSWLRNRLLGLLSLIGTCL